MEGKSSTRLHSLITFTSQLSTQNNRRAILILKVSYKETIAVFKRNAINLVKFLKYVQNFVLIQKIHGCLYKNLKFFKIAKGFNFALECLSSDFV